MKIYQVTVPEVHRAEALFVNEDNWIKLLEEYND
jgi:hypothetical protein